MTNALYMLLGAAFVAIGVLAAALADRIRGLRISRDAREPRQGRTQAARSAIPVEESPEMLRPTAVKQRAPRTEPKSPEGGEDVIAALVAAGYKKAIAAEATWACGPAERSTVEGWTAAALRKCARGGMS